ncbi:EAL domain-containing protein, partial [Pseudomonas syringae]|uniref:EAL domain-containing protein n=1 Tax=Pseudomonas syringae TaxID=317 RepID=UPI001E333096
RLRCPKKVDHCNEFMAFYQPQIDLHSYELSGIELLARWQHPCHGLLAPPQFFPSIVNAGLFNGIRATNPT